MKVTLNNANGYTSIQIDGQPHTPAAMRSFRPQPESNRNFADQGYEFFQVFPSGVYCGFGIPYSAYGEVWVGMGEYNWDNLKNQVDMFKTSMNPDGYVSVIVHADTRDWFIKNHPECLDSFNYLINAACCEEWKAAVAEYTCALMDKMEELMPGKVYGYFVVAGGTNEWLTNKGIARTPLLEKSYQEWVGDPDVKLPAMHEWRRKSNGVFRHPIHDREAIRFWRYNCTLIAQTVRTFCRTVKEHSGNTRLAGSFFGYQVSPVWMLTHNTNEIMSVIDDPNFDFAAAPISYSLRDISSSGGLRYALGSMSLRNKLAFNSIDAQTSVETENKGEENKDHGQAGLKSVDHTISFMRREVSMIISKGHGFWFFDMFGKGYQNDKLMKAVGHMRKVACTLNKIGFKNLSEVVTLCDLESNYYVADNYYARRKRVDENLARCGLPWDKYYAPDILRPDFPHDQTKVYIFLNMFKPSAEMREKVAQLRREGKCLIFLHAPGYITDDGFSLSAMSEFCGMEIKEAAVTEETSVTTDPIHPVRFGVPDTYTSWNLFRWLEEKDLTPMEEIDTRHNAIYEESVYYDSPRTMDASPFFTCTDPEAEVLARYEQSGEPSCAVKMRPQGGFDAWFASDDAELSLLSLLMDKAKAFRYSDSRETLYVNSNFLAAYSYTGGEKTLFWPEEKIFYDCDTGEEIRIGPDGVKIQMNPVETRVWCTEKIDH